MRQFRRLFFFTGTQELGNYCQTRSVADQGCLIRISEPTTATKEEGGNFFSFPVRADASQANSQSEKDTVYCLLAAIQNPSLLPCHEEGADY